MYTGESGTWALNAIRPFGNRRCYIYLKLRLIHRLVFSDKLKSEIIEYNKDRRQA